MGMSEAGAETATARKVVWPRATPQRGPNARRNCSARRTCSPRCAGDDASVSAQERRADGKVGIRRIAEARRLARRCHELVRADILPLTNNPPDDYHGASRRDDDIGIVRKKKKTSARLLRRTPPHHTLFHSFSLSPGREIVAKPSGPRRSGNQTALRPSGGSDAVAAPFQLGALFGYVQSNGNVLHAENTLFRVTLSEAGFVNYTRLGTDWIMDDPRGTRLFHFSGRGYPLLSPDGQRIFNIKTDLTGLIEMNRAGDAIWDRDFPSLMTSISLQPDTLLVGLLNGSLLLLNRQGSPVFELSPDGKPHPRHPGMRRLSRLLAARHDIGNRPAIPHHHAEQGLDIRDPRENRAFLGFSTRGARVLLSRFPLSHLRRQNGGGVLRSGSPACS